MTKIVKRIKTEEGNIKIILDCYFQKLGSQEPYLSSNSLRVLVNNKLVHDNKKYLSLDNDINDLFDLDLASKNTGIRCHSIANSIYHFNCFKDYYFNLEDKEVKLLKEYEHLKEQFNIIKKVVLSFGSGKPLTSSIGVILNKNINVYNLRSMVHRQDFFKSGCVELAEVFKNLDFETLLRYYNKWSVKELIQEIRKHKTYTKNVVYKFELELLEKLGFNSLNKSLKIYIIKKKSLDSKLMGLKYKTIEEAAKTLKTNELEIKSLLLSRDLENDIKPFLDVIKNENITKLNSLTEKYKIETKTK